MSDVDFVFLERNSAELFEAWKKEIAEHLPSEHQHRIAVVHSALEDLEPPHSHFDCIVSPANSYGIMDGGLDYYLSKIFSPKGDFMALTRAAQAVIKEKYFGFAPPGTCTLAPLDGPLRANPQFPHCRLLAVCPTMRYPMSVEWHRDLVYNTMWSLLAAVEHWNLTLPADSPNRIRKVAMSGLATGAGDMSSNLCARQMVLAIKHFWRARSEEGQRRWSDPQYPNWADVESIAKEVDSP